MTLTRDDIIRLRQQAGFSTDHQNPAIAEYVLGLFERFVQLVEAEISDKAAAALVAEGVSEYERGLKDGAVLERNACLAEIETGIWLDKTTEEVLADIAGSIRARGKKGGV